MKPLEINYSGKIEKPKKGEKKLQLFITQVFLCKTTLSKRKLQELIFGYQSKDKTCFINFLEVKDA